ncbi:MAG TPA: hypothetical protein VME22_13075 [Solirubrobacteraceae bacterium]|nr:hypothetical protein [Solirubrobacteraceae bacterium]
MASDTGLTQGGSRVLVFALGLLCAVALSLLAPSIALAKTTLHFFQKQVSMTLVGPTGQPLSPTATPAVGDGFVVIDLDYVGTANHHAKAWSASDHLACTFTSITGPMSGTATCNGQIAIGGSMLLAQNENISFSTSPTLVVPINGGTGKFRGARGQTKSTSISHSNNSNFTITFST